MSASGGGEARAFFHGRPPHATHATRGPWGHPRHPPLMCKRSVAFPCARGHSRWWAARRGNGWALRTKALRWIRVGGFGQGPHAIFSLGFYVCSLSHSNAWGHRPRPEAVHRVVRVAISLGDCLAPWWCVCVSLSLRLLTPPHPSCTNTVTTPTSRARTRSVLLAHPARVAQP